MPPPDAELKWCWKCYCKVWHHHGICEWADTHWPPDEDDAAYARDEEAKQRKRDAAEGFDDD